MGGQMTNPSLAKDELIALGFTDDEAAELIDLYSQNPTDFINSLGTAFRGDSSGAEAAVQPLTGPLADIMAWTPEKTGQAFDLARGVSERALGKTYDEYERAAERRALASGAPLSSRTAKDYGSIAASKANAIRDLYAQSEMGKIGAQQALPYQQLSTLEDIRRWEETFAQSQLAPWLSIGQSMYNIPWGQGSTTSGSYTSPGAGIMAGALGGAQAGNSMSGLLTNLFGGGGTADISSALGATDLYNGLGGSMQGWNWV
jgi:hypothetical protein